LLLFGRGGFVRQSIAYINLLLFLLFYLYGIMGYMAFSGNDQFHFGNLPRAIVSLWRAATLEDWTDMMYGGRPCRTTGGGSVMAVTSLVFVVRGDARGLDRPRR
jgi:hypothetical protein